MATTTTTTSPTGGSSTTRTYDVNRAENRALYWVIALLAVIIIGGLIYAYNGHRAVTSTTTSETSSATLAAPANPENPGTPNEPAGTQMNMGAPTNPNSDTSTPPPSTPDSANPDTSNGQQPMDTD